MGVRTLPIFLLFSSQARSSFILYLPSPRQDIGLGLTKDSKIDIVVANAGISLPKDPFLPVSDDEIKTGFNMAEIDVNLKGPLITSRIGLHYLRKNRNGGDLILVSSIAGWKECTGLVAYTASKHGVIGIMRGLHLSAIKEGIRINVICPWMTSLSPFKKG